MQIRNGIRNPGQAQSADSHIERIAADSLKLPFVHVKIGAHVDKPVNGVLFVPFRNRRMCGKNHFFPGFIPCLSKAHPASHFLPYYLKTSKQCVSLIEMEDMGIDAQSPECPHSSDTKDHFLRYPLLAEPPIELSRNPAGLSVVAFDVGVQKIQVIHTMGTITPYLYIHVPFSYGYRHGYAGILEERVDPVFIRVIGRACFLVYKLLPVSLFPQDAYTDNGIAQVA